MEPGHAAAQELDGRGGVAELDGGGGVAGAAGARREGRGHRAPPELDNEGGVAGPVGVRGGGGGGSGATPELGHGGDAHRRWGSTAMASAVGRARRAQMGFGGGGRLGRQQQLEARGRRRSEMGTRKQGRRCGLERKREVGGHRCPYTRTYPCRWA